MKILMAASECVPFIKTGGLADVLGALPKALAAAGEDVRIVIPKYGEISEEYRSQMTSLGYFYINLGWRRQYCGIETLKLGDITFYFIDNEYYFNRPYIYGLGGDEAERFGFFSRAVLEMLPRIDFFPDILHCHDWQTGLVPMMLRTQYLNDARYQAIRTVYTIHNLQYQGIFPIDYVEDLLTLGKEAYLEGGVEFYGQCSFMKGGINFADKITTVSPTYSKEIQTAYYGERLDGLLRAKSDKVTGVLNGIDMEEYNPEKDALIEITYTSRSPGRKKKNKMLLQKQLGLEVDENIPMIGMIGRLADQKGLDLVERVLEDILKLGVQLVILGKGDDRYVRMLNWAQWKYEGRVAACIEMNHKLAHQIYASSDLFLMPSKFEPCGLSQLIALRYGTLPIVRETGGLKDTVFNYNEYTGAGNGFSFANYNAQDMLRVIERAVNLYREDNKAFLRVVRRAMNGQYGWDKSAMVYMEVYDSLIEEPEAAVETVSAPQTK